MASKHPLLLLLRPLVVAPHRALAFLVVVCPSACLPSLPVEVPPEIVFSYVPGATDFGPAGTLDALVLSPGQRVDLRAYAFDTFGTDGLQQIDRVRSTDDDVVTGDTAGGPSLTLQGVAEGSADVAVKATYLGFEGLSGVRESRAATLHVAVAAPTAVDVDVGCGDGAVPLLPAGQTFYVPYAVTTAGGVASGFAPVIVDADPPGALDIAVDRRWTHAWSARGDVPGTVTLRGLGDEQWRLTLVTPADVTGAALPSTLPIVPVGSAARVRLQPLVDDAPVCRMQLVTAVHTTTPARCAVSADPIPPHDGDVCPLAFDGVCDEPGACWPGTDATDCTGHAVPKVDIDLEVIVEGLSSGSCDVVVTWPDARGGAGVESDFSVVIE